MATKKGDNNRTPRRVGARKAEDKKPIDPLKPVPGTATDPMQQLVDAFTNPLARIGFGTPSLLEGTQYPITRLSQNYPLLISMYRNSWITRNLIDGFPEYCNKTGYELTGQIAPKQIDQMERLLEDSLSNQNVAEAQKLGRLFGGAVALMAIEGHERILDQPLDIDDVEIGSYQGLIVFDRWSGVSPEGTISSDIRRPEEFGLPEYYLIQPENGSPYKVHASRLLRFIGPSVPRWELQAQQYWGISEIEVVFEELKKFDNIWWAIANMCFRANVFVLKDPAIAQLVSGIGISGQAARNAFLAYEALSQQMSNQGIVVLGKDGGLENHQTSFSGLSDILQTAMLNIAGATSYPMTVIFGRTASGLGTSNEGDEAVFYDKVKNKQRRDISPQLRKLLPVVAMSTLGHVPSDLGHKWRPIQDATPKEKAELAKSLTDGILVAFNAGAVGLKTTLKELKQSSYETSLWSNITDEAIAAADDTPAAAQQAQMQQMGSALGAEPDAEASNAPGAKEPKQLEAGESSELEKPKMGALQKLLGLFKPKSDTSDPGGEHATVKVKEPKPTSGSGSQDAAPVQAWKRLRVDPADLTLRGSHFGRLAQVSQRFRNGIDLPLALIERDGEFQILDGDHRAVLGVQNGWRRLPAIAIPGAYYDKLKALKFSDDDISAGMMSAAQANVAAKLEENEHERDEPEISKKAMRVAEILKNWGVVLRNRANDARPPDHNTPRNLIEAEFAGFKIGIEYPKGTYRELRNAEGDVVFSKLMPASYGFFEGTEASDGDEIDAIIGDAESSKSAFVFSMKDLGPDIEQREDEPKIVLGASNYDQAEKLFRGVYGLEWIGGCEEMTLPELREWLKEKR